MCASRHFEAVEIRQQAARFHARRPSVLQLLGQFARMAVVRSVAGSKQPFLARFERVVEVRQDFKGTALAGAHSATGELRGDLRRGVTYKKREILLSREVFHLAEAENSRGIQPTHVPQIKDDEPERRQ